MSDWFFGLSVFPMALVVFAITYLIAALIFVLMSWLVVSKRVGALKGLNPTILAPVGAVFALLLVFSAEPVWTNYTHAKQAIATEASGLRDALILAESMPSETQTRLHTLIGTYIEQAARNEWPAMASNRVPLLTHHLCGCSEELLEALQYMRDQKFQDDGQRVAQRDIVNALQVVRVARRELILISEDDTGNLRFHGLVIIGLCLLTLIALVHHENRRACALALTLFATVAAMSTLLVVSYTNPFSGGHALSPRLLQEVMDQ
jgi:hypothetical protein